MKLITLAILALSISSSANAYARITATGAKADAIIQALTNLGVATKTQAGMPTISVSAVQLTYTPSGWLWAQGELVDNLTEGKVFYPNTQQAFEIYSALGQAGVAIVTTKEPIETHELKIEHIECNLGIQPVCLLK